MESRCKYIFRDILELFSIYMPCWVCAKRRVVLLQISFSLGSGNEHLFMILVMLNCAIFILFDFFFFFMFYSSQCLFGDLML